MIAPFDTTGYGQASLAVLKSLRTFANVTPKVLNLGGCYELNEEEKSYFNETGVADYDAVIQMSLPEHFTYDARAGINIGWFFWESDRLPQWWVNPLKTMDMIFVSNKTTLQASINSLGHKANLRVVPIPCDPEIYKKEHTGFNIKFNSNKKPYIFYSIGEWTERKNYRDLVRAFHLAFDPNDPVELIIKTGGATDEQIWGDINTVKQSLGLYEDIDHYKKEIIINQPLPYKSILSMHQNCDCFVSTSLGEGWSLPTFDAYAFGNPTISPVSFEENNFSDFHLYRSEERCNQPPLYTGDQKMYRPSVDQVIRCMREAYKSPEKYEIDVSKFSYESIGKMIGQKLQYIEDV
jgi:hypothetical protein